MPERVKTKFVDDDNNASTGIERPSKRQKVNEAARKGRIVSGLSKGHTAAKRDKSRIINGRPSSSGSTDGKTSEQKMSIFSRSTRLRDRADTLLKTRRCLPIWNQADKLRGSLRNGNDVLLLVGETGSGKSTQVAQFLVDEIWAQRKGRIGGCIAVTEPRKVAAVSLARRVAEEVGTPLGSSSPASTVGYHVRFDRSISAKTKIKFLTEGMLLQEMLRDPWLREYSAVIVDEVHERNVNVDLILGFLRNIISSDRSGRDGVILKVIAMSATADLEGLRRFFDYTSQSHDTSNIQPRSSLPASAVNNDSDAGQSLGPDHERGIVSMCHIKGRQYPVKVLYAPNSVDDIIDASFRLIFKINFGEALPGDILVFLTGREAVESLVKLVNDWSPGLRKDVPQILALPLFASLSQNAQQRVFQAAPAQTRKVIIATNVAETSITVPGVRHVIDCGKSKVKQYRAQVGLESLLCKPVSQDAATQRKGRAGREAAGSCYRMYTEETFKNLDKATVPEILRCDLAHAILTMKAKGIEEPWLFPLLDSPPLKAIANGLEQLYQLEALDDQGRVTQLGEAMARLPLSPPLARALVAASSSSNDCLAEVIDIVSCLSVEAIFLQPSSEEAQEDAANARTPLVRREGDHLTLLAAMQAYTNEQTDRKAWCDVHLISHRAMKGAWNIRKQLRNQASKMRLGTLLELNMSHEPSPAVTTEEHASAILKCLLKGSMTRSAVLCADGAYRTCDGKHEISIHPASVLFGKKVEAILYGEHIYTSQSWARNVSAIETQWIEAMMNIE